MAKADTPARALLQEFDVPSAPVDLFPLTRGRGVQFVPQDLDDDVSGMLLRRGGRCMIGVHRTHPRLRRRFTVAHELGLAGLSTRTATSLTRQAPN